MSEADNTPVDHTDPQARRRTYEWPEPTDHDSPGTTSYSGPEALQRVLDGELHISPGAHTLGLRLQSFDIGRVELLATPGPWACNNGGSVHGGIVSGWVDSALGYATASSVESGVGYSTLDLTVRYLRPLLLEDCPVTVTASTVHCGRSTAVVDVEVRDARGRRCAWGNGAMMLFRPPS